MLKNKFSKKATKFETISHLICCLLSKGTIHLRHGKFLQFLTPTPLPSAFQQNAYEGDF